MILGLGGHVGPWAAQALPLGAAFPPLHPCWKAGQLAMFSRESEVWIFMHNPLILRVATNPPPLQKKKVGPKCPESCAGISLSLQSLHFFRFWPTVGSAVVTERNLIHVGRFKKSLNAY